MASKVYYIQASVSEGERAISEKARALFRAGKFKSCFRKDDFTAVKVHVGEEGNTTYIKAPCLKGLVEELVALKTKPRLRLGDFRGHLSIGVDNGRRRKVKLPYRGRVIEGTPASESSGRQASADSRAKAAQFPQE